jgi:hypothetical protein
MPRHIAPVARPPQEDPVHSTSGTDGKTRAGDAYPALKLAATSGQLAVPERDTNCHDEPPYGRPSGYQTWSLVQRPNGQSARGTGVWQ